MSTRKRFNRSMSRARLQAQERYSELQFRELKARKSSFGFTSRLTTPNEIINIGRALDVVARIDPSMKETVVQYNRNIYEKNRIFIYCNNDKAAEALRTFKKLPFVEWNHALSALINTENS